jgi:hypothetical protein
MAPVGYLNVVGADGRKIIVPDPQTSPIIAHVFGWYASGTLSLKETAEKARAAGLTHRRSSKAVTVSSLHVILRNRHIIDVLPARYHLLRCRRYATRRRFRRGRGCGC